MQAIENNLFNFEANDNEMLQKADLNKKPELEIDKL